MIEEEKVIEPIENKTEKVKIEIKKEEPVDTKSKTSLKNLPTDKYFKLTVQDVLQQGLLNIAMVHGCSARLTMNRCQRLPCVRC